MKATIVIKSQKICIDLQQFHDLSIPIDPSGNSASAWYCPAPIIEPVRNEYFTGSIKEGGAVNFMNVYFNPHGNGTHTECVGHISNEHHSINQLKQNYFFLSQLISIEPTAIDNDRVITLDQLKSIRFEGGCEGLIIRTLPNNIAKRSMNHSNKNAAYMDKSCMNWLYNKGFRHIMIDTPSIDKEEDNGELAAHHAWWNYPESPRLDATITELIYVDNTIKDGLYFTNLQLAAIENDASPSRPLIFELL